MTELFYKLPQILAARKDLTGNDKLVWAIIHDYIGQNPDSWPGIKKIMDKSGLARGTVLASIHKLESIGFLTVERRGFGKSNHYRTSLIFGPVQGLDRSKDCTRGGLNLRPELVQGLDCIQTDPLNQTRRGRGFFEELWNAYPKKAAKAQAEKAFAKLNPSPELYAAMLAALDRQKQSDQWQKADGRYIPHLANWLKDRRWEDIPDNGGMMPTREVTEAEADELLKGMRR